MSYLERDIELERERSYGFTYTFTSDTQDPIDISGYDFYFTMKLALTDVDRSVDTEAVIQKDTADFSILGTGSNIMSLNLLASELDIAPASYFYDIVFKNGDVVQTLQRGKFKIKDAVTMRVIE